MPTLGALLFVSVHQTVIYKPAGMTPEWDCSNVGVLCPYSGKACPDSGKTGALSDQPTLIELSRSDGGVQNATCRARIEWIGCRPRARFPRRLR